MVIAKCTAVFKGTFSRWGGGGSREGVMWEDFVLEEFIIREENFHEDDARKTMRK